MAFKRGIDKKILSFYSLSIKSVDKIDGTKDVFKLTDEKRNHYFLKIYKKRGGSDFMPGENVYHTDEQIQIESEILHLLSNSALETAVPIKNKMGEWVTIVKPNSEYATVTSFIDAAPMEKSQAPFTEMAFSAGVCAARLHLASEERLLAVASQRPHKRQDYMKKMQERLAYGITTGAITAPQFEMLSQCGDVILDCMNRLDENPRYNIGLVHTDIRSANCMYTPGKVIPIDFSRCLYSYYLYDLGEMCAHMGEQNAILRGYQSIKPLGKGHLFAVQAFMAMFLMMVIAETVDASQNSWRTNLLKTFEDEFHPGLVSGKGFLDPSVLEGIYEL